MQLFYLSPRITKKMAKSCKDAMKLMSPQCVLHKFLLLQDVATRCRYKMSLQLDPRPTFTQCRRCPGERDFDIRFEKHTDNVFEKWITLWIVSVGITSRMWRKQKESDYFDSESFESDPDLQRCCHRVKIAYATPTSFLCQWKAPWRSRR